MTPATLENFTIGLGRTSIQAGVLVLAVGIAQWLFRKRLGPNWRCALWLLIVARLLLPVSWGSVASIFNLIPALTTAQMVPPAAPDTQKTSRLTVARPTTGPIA